MAPEPTMAAKCTAEFVGTFLLIFTVGCNVLGGSAIWAGVSIAFVLMVSIYALGGISGANFNPAVSVTLGISKSIGGPGLDWTTVGIYSGVQCVAGIVAGVCYSLLFGQSFNLAPAKGFSWYHAGLCELLYTFMLTFVVMNVAAAKKNATEKNQYYGMAIAFTVVAGAYGAGAVSGGCFNPAVALGIDLSSAGLGFGWSLVYIVFELLGAGMAAALFKVVRPEDFGGEKSQVTELVSEFLGTYMLVLTVGLNVLGQSKAAAFSIAAGLTSMIYALGDVSGAHFNPAVTVAILASGRCPDLTPAKAGTYAGIQIAGGIAAALTYAFIYQGATFGLGPVGSSTWAGVSVAEIVYTFVLCFVVLCVAVSERTKASHLFGLAIGSCVTVGGFAIGGISGGSLNPAVSFGIATAALFNGGIFYKAGADVPIMAPEPTMAAKCTAEFVGTFLLIFTVGCNVLGGSAIWAGVSIAFVLMVSIYALGGISGANFNPAVSVTLGISKSIGGPGLDWTTVGIYSGVQCVAGIVAGVCYSLLFGQSFNLAPAKGFSWYHAGLCELLYTFMLTFVVMNVAAAKKNATEKNQYYGMAIAFTVVAGAYGAGAVSGGCFNPAVALGIDLSSAGLGFGWSLVYIVFELLGAGMAAALFKVVRPEDFGGEKSQVTELVSEFLGTYMLVLTVGLNVLGQSKAAAFSIAAGLTSMIYALGDVSGAHFNPAVTVAILASGRCPDLTPAKAGTYAGIQIAGGIAAALTYAFIYQGATFGLGPVGSSTWAGVSVAEIVYTFVLCFVVLCVAVSERTKASHLFGLAIGSCVTVGGFAIGGISGGSLNPAVSLLGRNFRHFVTKCNEHVTSSFFPHCQQPSCTLDPKGRMQTIFEVWHRCCKRSERRLLLQGIGLRVFIGRSSRE
eukprot:Skav217468  [mRNA]  locus=scaffold1405:131524:135354:- [translate_table: standard]